MADTHKKSIAKAITWRIIAVVITTTVAFLFTKEIILSLGIGALDTLIKLVGYYIHERAWNKVTF